MPVANRHVTECRRQFWVRVARTCPRAYGSVVGVATEASEVVLTYDDGPAPDTGSVLDVLAEVGASATFFVLLGRVRRRPDILADILAAGHEVGLHGPDHRRLTSFDPGSAKRRTQDALAELEDTAGHKVRWFRPPYGKQVPAAYRRITRAGLVSVSWTADMRDWYDVPQADRVESALRAARPGAILLGHDGFADASDGANDRSAPAIDRADLLRRVVAAFGERGLALRSLGAALEHGAQVRAEWFSH